MVLEQVIDQSYGALVRDFVGGGLNLQNTHFLTYPDDAAIANGYDETLLRLGTRNLTGFRRSLESGGFSAGGILSTSEVVARFVHASFTGQIVSNPIMAQMTTFVEAPDEDVPLQTGYGLGIRKLVIEGENLIGHTGTIPGYSGIVMYNPQKNYTIALLSNVSVVKQTELFAELQGVVVNR